MFCKLCKIKIYILFNNLHCLVKAQFLFYSAQTFEKKNYKYILYKDKRDKGYSFAPVIAFIVRLNKFTLFSVKCLPCSGSRVYKRKFIRITAAHISFIYIFICVVQTVCMCCTKTLKPIYLKLQHTRSNFFCCAVRGHTEKNSNNIRDDGSCLIHSAHTFIFYSI